jgi:hypothetical protein
MVIDVLGAVELYRIALSRVSEQGLLKAGEICELFGHSMFKAAMQADGSGECARALGKPFWLRKER